mgnify:CR=1 FL=1|tara:strand:+ start:218 stop:535 length:318 start_codon:yes stop_codon:yes gene_type:complete
MSTIKTPFYKVEIPTTAQFLEAIEKMEYFTIDQLNKKRKQLKAYFDKTMLIGQVNVTNCGGYPIIFDHDVSYEEVLSEFNEDWSDMSEEDRAHEIELFGCYVLEL